MTEQPAIKSATQLTEPFISTVSQNVDVVEFWLAWPVRRDEKKKKLRDADDLRWSSLQKMAMEQQNNSTTVYTVHCHVKPPKSPKCSDYIYSSESIPSKQGYLFNNNKVRSYCRASHLWSSEE